MAFSRVVTTYTGTNLFSLNFTLGYLSEDHVTARVNDEVDGLGDPIYRNITFITEGTVSIDGTLVNGDTVVFERTVPKDAPEHDFSDGAIIIEKNLDDNQKQAIMLTHEILDGRITAFVDDIDMGGFKITNMAEGVADDDAATVAQLNTTIATVQADLAAAEAARDAAAVSETNAATSAWNAATSASNASTSETNAAASETAAAGSADLAEKWATEAEDVEVTAGAYSAYHWAQKAQDFASGSADAISYNNSASGLTATNVQDAIDEVYVATELVQDTTPQLGGDLDLNSHAIDFPTTPNITDCLDEDDMASDSATALATQQSIKAYVDALPSAQTIRQIPQNLQSTAYTLVLEDGGKHIFHPSADTTARTWTIPANASVSYEIGTAITFVNQAGAGTITISITSDTMRLADDGSTGSRTLGANGIATALKVTSTEWIISGVGLS